MSKTFEVSKRYTLTHFHDQINSSIPAKFTKGIHRDTNSAYLAYQLQKRKHGNSGDELGWHLYVVLLDKEENCLGVISIDPYAEIYDGMTGGEIDYRRILSIVTVAGAEKVMFVDGDTRGWYEAPFWRQVPSKLKKALELIDCEFIEMRYVGSNGETRIFDGNE